MKFIISLHNNSTVKSFLLIGAISLFATACGRMDVDTTAPIITLDTTGLELTSDMEMMVSQGADFTPPSSSANDDRDGDISDKVEVSNSVNTFTPGIYKVIYTVSDSAGNSADAVTLTVFVNGGTSDEPSGPYTDANGCPVEPGNNIVGCWQMLPEKSAFGVGPTKGDNSWWSSTEGDVTLRDCIFDDIFRINPDGTFANEMGDATWVEEWQGEQPSCKTPIAPHDGSNPATYSYDSTAGTLTVTGAGAHIGLAKVYNGGELGIGYSAADVPNSITYEVTELTENTMMLDRSIGNGFWNYRLFRTGNYVESVFEAPPNSEEYPSQRGLPADDTKWHQQTIIPNGTSWYNGELQHYTERNTYVSDGTMKIVARGEEFTQQRETKQFTSSRLNSKYKFTYGKVEVHAKLPSGAGVWPAIWMLGANTNENGAYWQIQGVETGNELTGVWPAPGEIDIMEMWFNINPNRISSSLHTTSSHTNTSNTQTKIVAGTTTEFHTYAVDWNAERMEFSVDGEVFYTYGPSVKTPENWPFDSDQYLILNVAVEGGTETLEETAMEIDWVRVYDKDAVPGDDPVWSDEFNY